MAPMDVEKRMNLSLDAIIKQSGDKGRSGRGRSQGAKGRGKAQVEKPSIQKARGKDQTKKPDNRQRLKKGLGVQKKGLKIQKGGKKVAVAIAQPRREGKGRKVTPAKRSGNPRRAEPRDVPRRRDRRPGREGSGKRTVDLPRLTDLRITISNDKAGGPSYQMASMGAPGFQANPYQSQPMWAAPTHIMQQPVYGYGPRNLQPRESFARMVPEVPVPRVRMEHGTSRKAPGSEPYVPRRAYKDFDDPNQNKSYMRMDNR